MSHHLGEGRVHKSPTFLIMGGCSIKSTPCAYVTFERSHTGKKRWIKRIIVIGKKCGEIRLFFTIRKTLFLLHSKICLSYLRLLFPEKLTSFIFFLFV